MTKTDKDKFKVLFVCTGNTCRSPTAEGILKKMLKEKGIGNFEVGSAGTHGLKNAPASLFAIEVAKSRKVNLSGHRSRELTAEMICEADLILAMSQEHLYFVKRIDQEAEGKAYLLKSFLKSKPPSNEDQNRAVLFIKDPIGGSLRDYEQSFSEIEKEVKRIFPKILDLTKKR